ncbi:MAG: hypothetical protein HMLKMBBP_01427 [Planctomycetes bacterium]|nr:hypothetical protein [Planctomycetota bacterium]
MADAPRTTDDAPEPAVAQGATPTGAHASAAPLPANVRALAAVSFLTDVASEMIYPLLPGFLTRTLGAGTAALGAIEGAAETVSAFLKLASGRMSDRMSRRKPLVAAGYAVAALARPLVAAAGSAAHVLAVRLTDRVGKGIRTSPRDALIADSVPESQRGRAYGFHRAADHAGAVVGPLVAFALMTAFEMEMRTVFWLAAVPGLAAVAVLLLLVRDVPRAPNPPRAAAEVVRTAAPFGRPFTRYLGVLFVFTLANCADAFLLLRAAELGVPAAQIPLLWAAHHVVKSLSSTPAGALSDRIGRRPVLFAGWTWFAATYAGFAFATETWHAWAVFLGYGVFFGLTEGVEKALVADLVPAPRRGAAFGWFHAVIALGAFPASLLFGLAWSAWGSAAAFLAAGTLALAAALGLSLVLPARGGARGG